MIITNNCTHSTNKPCWRPTNVRVCTSQFWHSGTV